MKQGIYQSDGRLWADWLEPEKYGPHVQPDEWQSYASRPSIPVHPDLQKVWEVGKCYVRDVDYYLMNEGGTTALPMAVPIEAVPIPAKQTKAGEWTAPTYTGEELKKLFIRNTCEGYTKQGQAITNVGNMTEWFEWLASLKIIKEKGHGIL